MIEIYLRPTLIMIKIDITLILLCTYKDSENELTLEHSIDDGRWKYIDFEM